MKKLIILISVLGLFGAYESVMAENWKLIGEHSAAKYWYDTDSVQKVDGRIFRVWQKTANTKRRK